MPGGIPSEGGASPNAGTLNGDVMTNFQLNQSISQGPINDQIPSVGNQINDFISKGGQDMGNFNAAIDHIAKGSGIGDIGAQNNALSGAVGGQDAEGTKITPPTPVGDIHKGIRSEEGKNPGGISM